MIVQPRIDIDPKTWVRIKKESKKAGMLFNVYLGKLLEKAIKGDDK